MLNEINNYYYIIAAIMGYFIGSIPFGLVLAPLFNMSDIRKIGSGSIGATNALRTGNKKFAIAVLIGDSLKGVIAVLLAMWLFADTCPIAPLYAGFAAVLGHCFPVWMKFKGGKGVATAVGVLLILNWQVALCCLAIWLLTVRLSRYSALGALMAAVHAPIYALAIGQPDFVLPAALMGLILIITHRSNISRLLKGEESVSKLKKDA